MNVALHNVSVTVGKRGSDREALSAITLNVDVGESVIVAGPNGAGKSVMIKTLAGIIDPSNGTVTWDGEPLKDRKMEYKFRVGYLPQNPTFYEDHTVMRCFRYFGSLKAIPLNLLKDRIWDLMEQLDLQSVADRRVRQLSGGERLRLALGVALLNDPDLLLLDEPVTHQDPDERLRLWKLLSALKQGRTIVLATHLLAGLEPFADRVLILDEGRLALDTAVEDFLEGVRTFVWSVTLPIGFDPPWTKAHVDEELRVVGRQQLDGMMRWKILSTTRPTELAKQEEPTLEDAYLWLKTTI